MDLYSQLLMLIKGQKELLCSIDLIKEMMFDNLTIPKDLIHLLLREAGKRRDSETVFQLYNLLKNNWIESERILILKTLISCGNSSMFLKIFTKVQLSITDFTRLWETATELKENDIIQILFDYILGKVEEEKNWDFGNRIMDRLLGLKSFNNILILLDRIYEWKVNASDILDLKTMVRLIDYLGSTGDYKRSFKLIFELENPEIIHFTILGIFKDTFLKNRHFELAQQAFSWITSKLQLDYRDFNILQGYLAFAIYATRDPLDVFEAFTKLHGIGVVFSQELLSQLFDYSIELRHPEILIKLYSHVLVKDYQISCEFYSNMIDLAIKLNMKDEAIIFYRLAKESQVPIGRDVLGILKEKQYINHDEVLEDIEISYSKLDDRTIMPLVDQEESLNQIYQNLNTTNSTYQDAAVFDDQLIQNYSVDNLLGFMQDMTKCADWENAVKLIPRILNEVLPNLAEDDLFPIACYILISATEKRESVDRLIQLYSMLRNHIKIPLPEHTLIKLIDLFCKNQRFMDAAQLVKDMRKLCMSVSPEGIRIYVCELERNYGKSAFSLLLQLFYLAVENGAFRMPKFAFHSWGMVSTAWSDTFVKLAIIRLLHFVRSKLFEGDWDNLPTVEIFVPFKLHIHSPDYLKGESVCKEIRHWLENELLPPLEVEDQRLNSSPMGRVSEKWALYIQPSSIRDWIKESENMCLPDIFPYSTMSDWDNSSTLSVDLIHRATNLVIPCFESLNPYQPVGSSYAYGKNSMAHCGVVEMNHNRKWSLSAEADPILIEQSKRPESISSQTDSNEQPDNYYPVPGNRRLSSFPHNSVPTNIPKASTFKMFLHSPSVSHSFPKPDFNMGISPSDKQVLSNHLMEDSQTFGSVSHSLLGGETTRDIYQWKEKQQSTSRKRRNSEPNLVLIDENEESIVYASELREPGVFRRFFMAAKAAREGKAAPVITKNFIDFLVLYGTYGGDVCPSDDEEDEEESEDAPLLRSKSRTPSQNTQVQGTSAKKAFFMLLKAFVGTGVLFLPQAFKNGGMGFSIVILIFLGYLNLYCMNLLVEASIVMGGLSFGDMAHQLFGSGFKKLVLGSIAISQMGFSCAYYIFVAANLRYLTLLATSCRWDFPQWFFMAIQVLVYVPLSWVRKIKSFSTTSLIADVFILFGLVYILSFDIFKISSRGIAKDLLWINLESFPLLIGTAMFAFEGICLILPIAGSMKKPEQFSSVITWCMFTIVVVLTVIGSMGYLALGNDVSTVIFLDLPQGSFPNGLQFLYVIAIILSFPLCVYPAIRITEQGIFGHKNGKSSRLVKWQKNIFRTLLVSFLGVVAWAGSDSLDKVVSLVGCLACIPLSFIYPAMFHYKITTSQFYKTIDILLIVFGTISMIYTTFVTLQQWAVNAPSPQKDPCRI